MRRVAMRVLTVAVLGLAACGGSDASSPNADELHGAKAESLRVVSKGDLRAVDLTKPPVGDVVLSLTGSIGVTNNGDSLDLDLATIERLQVVDLTAFEPFEKRDIVFRGVWLKDLLAIAGADAHAKTVRIHAIDDYEVEFTPAQLSTSALLATMADGELLPLSKAGPTRIVFSDGDKVGGNKDLWIWSLDLITVE